MHLYLTPEEYEQKIDMRRLYKMSASMVLALAIEWFLEKIIACWYDSDQMNTIINVHFSQKHAIIPEYREESAQYRLIWGRSPS
jgi:hypothetical protein